MTSTLTPNTYRRFTYVCTASNGRCMKLDLTTPEVSTYRASGWTVYGPVAF